MELHSLCPAVAAVLPLQLADGIGRAVLPVEDAADKLPAPAVIKDHSVHCVVDFSFHQKRRRFPARQ